MPGAARLGDKSMIPACVHGSPCCPHPATGPAISGSPDVNIEKLPAIRQDDPGLHAVCCGPNTWVAKTGSATVKINGKGAHRMGDQDQHCGSGMGQMIEGSATVIIGG
jgi:uncharacterized Zn-binding protein involved in type VI secretion